MVETPNNLEWEQLETALGENAVRALRNLGADDKDVRSKALWELGDMLCYQGTYFWWAALVVPFLLERLQHESDLELLERILIDLAQLGTGNSFCDAPKDFDWILQDRQNTTESQAQVERELSWVRVTHEAVYKGVDVYLNFLEHDSPDIRIAAAYTLACCKLDAAQICTRMCRRFRSESEELVKAAIPLCLAILSNSTPVDTAFFEELLNSNESDRVKLSTAIALAFVAGENMSDHALEMLVQLIGKPNLFTTLCDRYQDRMSEAHGLFHRFLTRLNDRQMARIIPVLARVWEHPDSPEFLLELAFRGQKIQEGTTVHDLTDSQRLLLQAIADNDRNWEPSEQSISDSLSFIGIKGKPTREKLIGFLNRESSNLTDKS